MLFYSSYVPHTKTKLNVIPGKSPSFHPLSPSLQLWQSLLLPFSFFDGNGKEVYIQSWGEKSNIARNTDDDLIKQIIVCNTFQEWWHTPGKPQLP